MKYDHSSTLTQRHLMRRYAFVTYAAENTIPNRRAFDISHFVFWIHSEIWIARMQQIMEMVYEGSSFKTALREYRWKNDRTLQFFREKLVAGYWIIL